MTYFPLDFNLISYNIFKAKLKPNTPINHVTISLYILPNANKTSQTLSILSHPFPFKIGLSIELYDFK